MRHLLTGIYILIAIVAMQGCRKWDKEQRPFLDAAIYRIPFSATGDQVMLQNNGSGSADRSLWASTGNATITIKWDSVHLGDNSLSLARATVQRGGITSYSVSGSLFITALNPYVTGSFSFICQDSVYVTGGSFLVYNK